MGNSSLEKLKNVFVKAFNLTPDTDFETLAYGQTTSWDSVGHMDLIMQIEMAFDIMLATEDVIGMRNFAKAKEIVARSGVSFT